MPLGAEDIDLTSRERKRALACARGWYVIPYFHPIWCEPIPYRINSTRPGVPPLAG